MSPAVVEVILGGEVHGGIILLAQILHPLRFADAFVLTGHMVRHEVDNHLHARLVNPFHQRLELLHAVRNILGQIRVYVIVISYGVWRPCPTLHHLRVLCRNAVSRVVGLRCMTNHAGEPDMAHAHRPDILQDSGREIVHLSTSVFGQRTILDSRRVTIAEKTRKDLINYYLMRCHGHLLLC